MPYLSPGVYVEEIDSGARPILAVGTSTAGFVGTAPNPGARLNEAVAINNWSQFQREFCRDGDASTDLANAVFGFFLNGGSRCYVVQRQEGRPHRRKRAGAGPAGGNRRDRDHRRPRPHRPGLARGAARRGRAGQGPGGDPRRSGPGRGCRGPDPRRRGRAPPPPAADTGDGGGKKPAAPRDKRAGQRPRLSDGGYGAFYFPWLRVRDALDPAKIVPAAPSGYMAGLWARTDAERGVHKAPANLAVRGAVGVTRDPVAGRAGRAQPRRRQLHPLLYPRRGCGSGAPGRWPRAPATGATSTSDGCSA